MTVTYALVQMLEKAHHLGHSCAPSALHAGSGDGEDPSSLDHRQRRGEQAVVGCEYKKAGKSIKEFTPWPWRLVALVPQIWSWQLATYGPDLLQPAANCGFRCAQRVFQSPMTRTPRGEVLGSRGAARSWWRRRRGHERRLLLQRLRSSWPHDRRDVEEQAALPPLPEQGSELSLAVVYAVRAVRAVHVRHVLCALRSLSGCRRRDHLACQGLHRPWRDEVLPIFPLWRGPREGHGR